MSSFAPENATQISKPLVFSGFAIGLLLSFGVLSGDENGRVNLLYLLLVFLFIPLTSAVISLVSLVRGKGINFARMMSYLPVWSKTQQNYLHKMRQMHLDKHWFFLQSQAAALAYSVAGLLVFIILLLATDINFVWRSTLLDAEQLLPLLKVIAFPWQFWDSAQPSLELLQLTQDSRLSQTYNDITNFGQWWPFIFATQLVYSFLLRGFLLMSGKIWLKQRAHNDVELKLSQKLNQHTLSRSHQHTLATVTHDLPEKFALTNWAGFDTNLLTPLQLSPEKYLNASPLIDDELLHQAEQYSGHQLLLVKAWEPPMGELQDFMQQGHGLLFPINYAQNQLTAPESRHLEEWQRFVNALSGWQIYLPSGWMKHYDS